MTDCVFMSSRDGRSWNRCGEAFLRPGPENGRNWVYGDCYPAVGMIETPCAEAGAEAELSLYCGENHWQGLGTDVYRYTLRRDGFASLSAGSRTRVLTTKPLIFTGDTLLLNFSTSARGSLYAVITDADGRSLESGELFGDRTDRPVDFGGRLCDFAEKPVTLRFTMTECDLFSMQFRASV